MSININRQIFARVIDTVAAKIPHTCSHQHMRALVLQKLTLAQQEALEIMACYNEPEAERTVWEFLPISLGAYQFEEKERQKVLIPRPPRKPIAPTENLNHPRYGWQRPAPEIRSAAEGQLLQARREKLAQEKAEREAHKRASLGNAPALRDIAANRVAGSSGLARFQKRTREDLIIDRWGQKPARPTTNRDLNENDPGCNAPEPKLINLWDKTEEARCLHIAGIQLAAAQRVNKAR